MPGCLEDYTAFTLLPLYIEQPRSTRAQAVLAAEGEIMFWGPEEGQLSGDLLVQVEGAGRKALCSTFYYIH